MLGRKIKGILKVGLASIGLCGGIISEIIGIPLWCTGQAKRDAVLEDYRQTEEYKIEAAIAEERIAKFEARVAEAEEKFNNGEITTKEFEGLKSDFDEEKKTTYEELPEKCIEKYDDQEYKGMLKQADTNKYVGIGFTVLGGVILLFKGIDFLLTAATDEETITTSPLVKTIASGIEDIKYVEPPRDFAKECKNQDEEDIEDCFK